MRRRLRADKAAYDFAANWVENACGQIAIGPDRELTPTEISQLELAYRIETRTDLELVSKRDRHLVDTKP